MNEIGRSPLPVTVVIVTWHSADVLSTCLESLGGGASHPAQLVIVDNASSDGSADVARAWAVNNPRVTTRIITNDTNEGFAAAANQGIAASSQDAVCLVNPDVRLLPDTLATLWAALSSADEDVAVVGGKLLRGVGNLLEPTQVIDSTGIVMTRDGRHLDRGADALDEGQFDAEEEVFGITGALAIFRRASLLSCRVDGQVFDEDFFAYREDADLAWRLRGFGYRAIYVPDAVAYHGRRVTPQRRRVVSPIINYHSVKNRFLLRIHHADAAWLRHFGLRSLMRDALVVGACITVERSSLPAFWWLCHHFGTHRRRRREILARRSVSPRALHVWFKQ